MNTKNETDNNIAEKILTEYSMPAILWFSRQDMVVFWESEAVLDRMETWLEQNKESFRRYPRTVDERGSVRGLGYVQVYSTTGEHYDKIRNEFKRVRGLLE